MAFSKRDCIVFSIAIFYLIDNISALSRETILGGTRAEPLNFRHQVIIEGNDYGSDKYEMMGGGVVLGDKFALSAASIFLKPDGEMRRKIFWVVAGSDFVNGPASFKVLVYRFFVPVFDPTFTAYNLVVLELSKGLGLSQNPLVAAVRLLPNPGEGYDDTRALVSGFGFNEVVKRMSKSHGMEIVVDGKRSTRLLYAKAAVLPRATCRGWYAPQILDTNLCVRLKGSPLNPTVGVCHGDIGGPLVVNDDLLLGIASNSTLDCDNTIIGALYARVAPFAAAIEAFMDNEIPEDAFVRYNSPSSASIRN